MKRIIMILSLLLLPVVAAACGGAAAPDTPTPIAQTAPTSTAVAPLPPDPTALPDPAAPPEQYPAPPDPTAPADPAAPPDSYPAPPDPTAPVDPTAVPPEPTAEAAAPEQSIAAIAAADPNFSTLVAALQAAGLVDLLAGPGDFTVFAPTNAAFAALPPGTLEALLEQPDGMLTDILSYHVAAGRATAEDVINLSALPTLSGRALAVSAVDGTVRLNGLAGIVATDIAAANGIIHVIDAVLVPPADQLSTVYDYMAGNAEFSTLLTALNAADLSATLAGPGEFTLFAPTNAAFDALPPGTLDSLLADAGGQLRQILLYHVLGNRAAAADVVTRPTTDTLQGGAVTITVTDGGVLLNNAVRVIQTDIVAANGVIHVIDAVLIPPGN